MKNFKILDVKMVDLNTLENYPGGAEFENEFKLFQTDYRLNYKFYDAADLELAEKRLKELDLSYSKYYQIETESDAEIKKHPAFFIIFSYEYKFLEITDGKLFLNPKKVKSKNFQGDIETEILFVSEKGKTFLEKETTGITFELVPTMPKPFYRVIVIPELNFPLIYSDETVVTEGYNRPDRYNVKSDGRVYLKQDALTQLAHNGLAICNTFQVNEMVYPSVHSPFIVSGMFADVLRQEFNFKKEGIFIEPLMLDGNE